ncbi:Vesicle-associated membrane protein 8 [Fukomys damarensis]|uniref:Vesicle-associated membrane protein 8 n=1 Tax=Fukomys damarensis TaxID=885580 RepID=A0A091DQ98_FUKDA|nr:Vesicle-associated membrane protein 8 [Fukomys damarensis]
MAHPQQELPALLQSRSPKTYVTGHGLTHLQCPSSPKPSPEEASGGEGSDRVRNLQSQVEGVKNIMTQNVERILARGENLDHLRNKTEDLEATSEHFKTTSQKVARKFWWKNVKMIIIICVIVFIIVLFIILFATGVIPT